MNLIQSDKYPSTYVMYHVRNGEPCFYLHIIMCMYKCCLQVHTFIMHNYVGTGTTFFPYLSNVAVCNVLASSPVNCTIQEQD